MGRHAVSMYAYSVCRIKAAVESCNTCMSAAVTPQKLLHMYFKMQFDHRVFRHFFFLTDFCDPHFLLHEPYGVTAHR